MPKIDYDSEDGPPLKPSNVLDSKNGRPGDWGKKDAAELGAECRFPAATEIYLLLHGERADWKAVRWAYFYEYPLKIGYTYQFTPQVKGVLKTMGVSPSPLMSQAWRVLQKIYHANSKLRVRFLVEDLVYTYKVHIYGAGRYMLYVKDDKEALLGTEP